MLGSYLNLIIDLPSGFIHSSFTRKKDLLRSVVNFAIITLALFFSGLETRWEFNPKLQLYFISIPVLCLGDASIHAHSLAFLWLLRTQRLT
ncbi:hypothetical protein BGZ60DRAFT_412515 [Tricladium varicosporioides]|nr:hypothetical protein BGZ60DRAFT_412515 [Hymenoscyphus varicosporioides]